MIDEAEIQKLADRAFDHCRWCGAVPELYMVHNHVWRAAFPEYDQLRKVVVARGPVEGHKKYWVLACMACLAGRIGRDLQLSDFPNLPVNELLRYGYRLGLADGRRTS